MSLHVESLVKLLVNEHEKNTKMLKCYITKKKQKKRQKYCNIKP